MQSRMPIAVCHKEYDRSEDVPYEPLRNLGHGAYGFVEEVEAIPGKAPVRGHNIGKAIEERWTALDETERAPYYAKADADRKRYFAEKEKFEELRNSGNLNVRDEANEDMEYKLPQNFEIKPEDAANTTEAEGNAAS
ncbi:hypothetical protein FGG08_000480 [Glutinoglossum americanum]|uniref:HMG box domain-containing protein n=1 Tax=Glutinoglossum americanum TaxID=1670608 RepID=A0A9P8I8Z3_9PEZI|nr:hypothetical protein FGG08_000480 [Glutinoglossum americanum]